MTEDPMPRMRSNMTADQIAKLRFLVEDTDMNLTDIAREMGWGFNTLKLRIAQSGLQVRRSLVSIVPERTEEPEMVGAGR